MEVFAVMNVCDDCVYRGKEVMPFCSYGKFWINNDFYQKIRLVGCQSKVSIGGSTLLTDLQGSLMDIVDWVREHV